MWLMYFYVKICFNEKGEDIGVVEWIWILYIFVEIYSAGQVALIEILGKHSYGSDERHFGYPL